MPEENEIDLLRRTNSELVAKNAKRKQRIAELEQEVANLTAKNAESTKRIHDLEVIVPLKQMAESISVVPDLFIEQLQRLYKVQSIDGTMALQTNDGKAVTTKEGKPVTWDAIAIKTFLTDIDHPQSKIFSAILFGSRASGAGGSTHHQGPRVQQTSPVHFGLK